eukprot:2510159-Rhodomonas_salina.3
MGLRNPREGIQTALHEGHHTPIAGTHKDGVGMLQRNRGRSHRGRKAQRTRGLGVLGRRG